MSFMETMMKNMMKNMNPEDKKKMISEMTGEMFQNMTPEDMKEIMSAMMPEMMDKCFSKMNTEQRKKMMTMCRTMLDKIEKKFLSS